MTGVPENKTVEPIVELTVGPTEKEDPKGFVEAISQQETETKDLHKQSTTQISYVPYLTNITPKKSTSTTNTDKNGTAQAQERRKRTRMEKTRTGVEKMQERESKKEE